MGDEITACGGRYARRDGVWVRTATGEPVPGASDMHLADLYPDLVIVSGMVLVPDVLVREQEDLAWVPSVAATDGPTDRYDRQRARTGRRTHGWARVWPVPIAEWDARNVDVLGVWAPELAQEDR